MCASLAHTKENGELEFAEQDGKDGELAFAEQNRKDSNLSLRLFWRKLAFAEHGGKGFSVLLHERKFVHRSVRQRNKGLLQNL